MTRNTLVATFPCGNIRDTFALTNQDLAALRSQIATLKAGRGQHRKYPPYAFTEHGAIMAANVLASPRAIEMSMHAMRAFARLRDSTPCR